MGRPPRVAVAKDGKDLTFEDAFKNLASVAQKRKSFKLTTIEDSMKDWTWVDFIDPKTRLPALALEYLWGARGLLTGRILKIEAEEGVGKSSYCMLQYAMAQIMQQAWCVHMEGEEAAAPPDFIAAFGCDPSRVITPEYDRKSIEDCFEHLDTITFDIRSKEVDPEGKRPILAGIDSISSFGSSSNMEDEISDTSNGLGSHARFLSKFFRDRWSIMKRRKVLLMAITQLRESISIGGFGAPKQAPGAKTTIAARPLNYHASYRLAMSSKPYYQKIDSVTVGPVIGELVKFKTTKNKISDKNKELEIPLIWNRGFMLSGVTLDLLCKLSPILLPDGQKLELQKAGSWLQSNMLEKSLQFTVKDYEPFATEVLRRICEDSALLMKLRESLRIRGFNFDFETKYGKIDYADTTPSNEDEEAVEDTLTELP